MYFTSCKFSIIGNAVVTIGNKEDARKYVDLSCLPWFQGLEND